MASVAAPTLNRKSARRVIDIGKTAVCCLKLKWLPESFGLDHLRWTRAENWQGKAWLLEHPLAHWIFEARNLDFTQQLIQLDVNALSISISADEVKQIEAITVRAWVLLA